MNHRLLAAVLAALLPSLSSAAPDWENEAVFRINKEAPRATAMPFPTRDGALSKHRLDSPWCQMLNGTWTFHHVGHPDQRPVDFFQPTFDVSGWDDIPVPANWQMHGYATVKDLFNHYFDPQESGNRGGARRATFSGGGQSLTFEAAGDHLLNVSAYPYSPLDIELARHPIDMRKPYSPLRKNGQIIVNIDYGQTGLGGTNSWGQVPLEKYQLSGDKPYAYAFRIIPGK